MRTRSVLLAAAAAVAVAAPHAAAAPKPVVVSDIAGDANGLNAQGFEDDVPVPDNGTASGPASYAAADIVSVKWASTIVRKKVTGFTITLTLGAAPASGITYRVEHVTPLCASFFAEYRVDYTGAAKTGVRCAASDGAATYVVPAAKVAGSTITWTVPLAALKGYKANMVLDELGAQTRGFIWFAGQTVAVPVLGNTTGLTVPQLDHVKGTAAYKIGS